MKATLKWRGNEDGKLRYLAGTNPDDLRVEVLTPAGEDVPSLSATVQDTSELPAGCKPASTEDVTAGRLSSIRVPVTSLKEGWLHRTRWVVVRCDDDALAIPLLVVPAWECYCANAVTALATVVAAVWAIDLYGAFPHGHGLETAGRVVELPVVALVTARWTGLLKGKNEELPALGTLHLLDRAGALALALLLVVCGVNHLLVTVQNNGEAPIDVGHHALAKYDRAIIPSPLPSFDPHRYVTSVGDPRAELADRVLATLEPQTFAISTIPMTLRASLLVDGCPTATMAADGCDVMASDPSSVRLFADRLLDPSSGNGLREAGQPLAMLLVSLPWPERPVWSNYLLARLHGGPAADPPVRAFFHLTQPGPRLLELSVPASAPESPVGVTPFLANRGSVEVAIDESAASPVVTKLEEIAVVDADRGGSLSCAGLDGKAIVEIAPLDATVAKTKHLEVSVEASSGVGAWRSTFTVHASGASRAWACRPPAAATPRYRFSVDASDRLRPWSGPRGFLYEVDGAGSGECKLAQGGELRRFVAEKAMGDIAFVNEREEVVSSFRPSSSNVQRDVWLCLPADSKAPSVKSFRTRTVIGNAPQRTAIQLNGTTILFPETPVAFTW